MTFIIQQGHRSEDKRREEHRRWPELCDSQLVVCMQINPHLLFSVHGRPDELRDQNIHHDKLSNRLIGSCLIRIAETSPNV